jgi:xylose dehydrogenase (NAD/NADP)
MWRHNPQTKRLVELLPEIGRLQTIRATFSFVLTNPANVRLRPELDGGSLMDVGCYCVSAARLLAGEPERVYGEQVVGETGIDLRFTGTLRFRDDVLAEFTSGFTTSHYSIEAIGSEGTLFVAEPWHPRDGVITIDGRVERIPLRNSYALQFENVGAAARGEDPILLGRADAQGQARSIAALYDSAERGAPVKLAR